MNEFLTFFNSVAHQYPMRLHIYYSSIMDWCIDIYGHQRNEMPFISCQSCDVELVFAEAQVELKKWMTEHRGGY